MCSMASSAQSVVIVMLQSLVDHRLRAHNIAVRQVLEVRLEAINSFCDTDERSIR